MADDPSLIVGLGTLAALKAAVLPGPLAAGTDFDAPLAAIGRSVAATFDGYTGRTLARTEALVWEGTADRSFVVVPAYPLESVSRIELLPWGTPTDGWIDYTADAFNAPYPAAGIVDLGYAYGTGQDRLRVTYTGGYWLDPGDGTPKPDAATALPADLFGAWTLQCAQELQARDVLGVGAVRDSNTRSAAVQFATGLTLAPQVVATLDRYRRLA